MNVSAEQSTLETSVMPNVPIYTTEELEQLTLDRRATLLRFSHEIGTLLGPRLLGHFEGDEERVTVSKADRERISEESIEGGLFIDEHDSRYKAAEEEDNSDSASGLVIVRSAKGVLEAQRLGLKVPCKLQVAGQPGVVFPPDEYPKVARSPKDLASTSMTAQRARLWEQNAALPPKQRMKRKEINEAVKAKARAVLRGYVDRTVTLEHEYEHGYDLIKRLRRQTRGLEEGETTTPQNQYKARNLAKDLKSADEMFRDTIEIAAIYSNWSDKQVQGAHRALTKALYRGISPRDNGIAWRYMTELQGKYINMRRFKLLQARARCEEEIAKHPKKNIQA